MRKINLILMSTILVSSIVSCTKKEEKDAKIDLLSSEGVSLTAHAFPSVEAGSSSDVTITIKNSGEKDAVEISGSFTSSTTPTGFNFKDGTFPGTGGTCSTTLSKNQSCTLVLSFAPLATAYESNSFTDTFTLSYKSDSTPFSSAITLSGTGTNCYGDATSLLSQTQYTTVSANAISSELNTVAQSFFWTENKKIKSFSVNQFKSSGATIPQVKYAIFADCSGVPCATALAETTAADPGILYDNRQTFTYTFSSPVSIVANETYWLVLSYPGLNGVVYTDKFISNGYGGGKYGYSSDGSNYTTDISQDLKFELFQCPSL